MKQFIFPITMKKTYLNPSLFFRHSACTAIALASFSTSVAAHSDNDRVMAFLYQNAPRDAAAPTALSPRVESATYIRTPPQQKQTPPPQQYGSYNAEVRRLHTLAAGGGGYRTPKPSQNDTIADIKNYIASNTSPNMNCWGLASARYDLNPFLLYSIALVESRMTPNAVSRPNSNRTRDIGLMQVNSSWLSSERFRRAGITHDDLKNTCLNIHIGAWVLKTNINTMGYNWRAIGAYNAWKNEAAQHRYATKVYTMYGLVMESRNKGELHRDPLAPLRRYDELERRKRRG